MSTVLTVDAIAIQLLFEGHRAEWFNQRKEDSFLPGKIIMYMEMIGILRRYSTMKCQLQATLLSTCSKMSKLVFRYPTYHEMSATINKCQGSYLEMLDTYPIAGIHETVSI